MRQDCIHFYDKMAWDRTAFIFMTRLYETGTHPFLWQASIRPVLIHFLRQASIRPVLIHFTYVCIYTYIHIFMYIYIYKYFWEGMFTYFFVWAFWWPDWKTRPKRRMPRHVCKKWLWTQLDAIGILIHPCAFWESVFLLMVADNNLRGKLEHESKWTSRSSATIERRIRERGSHFAIATSSAGVRKLEKKAGREWIWALEGRGIKETGDATD